MRLDQIKKLIQDRKIDQALKEINQVQEQDKIEGEIHLSNIFLIKKDFEQASLLLDKIISKSQISKNSMYEFCARINKLDLLWQLEKFDEFVEEVTYCDQIMNQVNFSQKNDIKEWLGDFMNFKALLENKRGDLDKTLDYLQQSIEYYKQIENHHKMFTQNIFIAWIKRVDGQLDEAIYHFNKSLQLSEKMGNAKYFFYPWAIYGLAIMNFYKGNLDVSMDLVLESLNLFEKIKNLNGITYSYSNLSSIYRVKGDLEKGLEYNNKIFQLYESKINEHKAKTVYHSYCMALLNTGKIYYEKNLYEKSIEYYERMLKAHDEICKEKNTISDFYVYYGYGLIIVSYLALQDTFQIDRHMSKLNELTKEWPTKIAKISYKKSLASILKSRKRAKFKHQAQLIFEELLKDPVDYESTFYDQINLCELLIDELKMSDTGGEDEIIIEIEELLNKISDNSKNQRSITTLLVSYSLQAKLALIEGDAEQSIQLLNRGLRTAEKKGLIRLYHKLENQKKLVYYQLTEWKTLLERNSALQERLEGLNLKQYISKAIDVVLENKFKSQKKYEIIYRNLLEDSSKIQKSNFKVAIAQIGLSKEGDLLTEFYNEIHPNLYGIKNEKIAILKEKVKKFITIAHKEHVGIIIFPELSIDLNYSEILDELLELSKIYNIYIIPGSYHDQELKQNISIVVSPEGILWKQVKHIPAKINYQGKRITEGIAHSEGLIKTIICETEYGRIGIIICRDFLDLDLRVELKNFDPPIDLIFNVAFTPVTTEFKSAHFLSRRSIYAYCFFANIADFGDSCIYSPEKDRTERIIPAKQENLIIKEVDLFGLRSERKKWEIRQQQQESFIQSTRI